MAYFNTDNLGRHSARLDATKLIAGVASEHPTVSPVSDDIDMTTHTLVTAHFDDGRVIGAGIVSDSGYMSSLVSTVPGVGAELLDRLVDLGGDHLDCYDVPWLQRLYRSRGFKVTHRFDWDHELAPANWPHRLGTPDYVYMRRTA